MLEDILILTANKIDRPIIAGPLVVMPGIVYVIGSEDGPERYVGATTCKLGVRWALHKSAYRKWIESGKPTWKDDDWRVKYASFQIFEKYGVHTCSISVLEEISDDASLTDRERHWIENTPNRVNRCVPGRTRKETCAAYYAKFTPEQKAARLAVQREKRAAAAAALTPEQRIAMNAKRRAAAKSTIASLDSG